VKALQVVGPTVHNERISCLQELAWAGSQHQYPLPLKRQNRQVQGGTQPTLSQSAPVERRSSWDVGGEDVRIKLVGSTKRAAGAGAGIAGAVGKEVSADHHHEGDAGHDDGGGDRREIEDPKGTETGGSERVSHQNVGWSGNTGKGTAEEAAECQRQEQAGGWAPAASCQVHRRRQQNGGHRDGVDECRQQAGGTHQSNHKRCFAALGEASQRLAEPTGNTRARQPCRQDEQSPHGNHCWTAEARQRLLRRDQPRQRQGRQHQQPHHVHRQPAAKKQNEGRRQNREQDHYLKRQIRLLPDIIITKGSW